MRHIRLTLLVVLIAGLLPAAVSRAATPKYKVAVGIGDQSPQIFTSPSFKKLRVKSVRYFIPWDAARKPAELAKVNAYVAAARKAKARVLLHVSTNDLRNKKGTLPSVKRYKTEVGRLVKRFKVKGVKDWGVWNEANHKSQETWNNPRRAAQYFLAMRRMCASCRFVALDVLDQPGATRYVARWYAALGRKNRSKAKVVGIHNYSDTNRYRSRGTSAIIKKVKAYNRRTDFWLTETGGVASFGRSFPCNTTRQAKAVKYMFTLTKKFRRDITRLYSYNFFGTTQPQCEAGAFDAGLVTAVGVPRKAYATFLSQARNFAR
jgi:hypothetical protein